MTDRFRFRRDILLIILLALLPSLLFWYTTPWGMGTSVDSIRYFQMAGVFDSGRPLAELGSHFPPGYPWLLSKFASDSYSISFSARILQVLLVFLLSGAILGLVYQLGPRVLIACLLIAAALLLRVDVFNIIYFAWSEILYSVLLVTTVWLFLNGLEKKSRSILLLAGAIGGASILVRYAGVSFAGLLVLAVFLFNPGQRMTERLVQGLILIVGIALPLVFWRIVSAAAGIEGTPRQVVFHLPSIVSLNEGVVNVGYWFNQGFNWMVGACFAVGLAGMCWLAWVQATTAQRNRLLILGYLILGYFGFLFATLLLFDAYVSLLPRILFPGLLIFLILLGLILSLILQYGALVHKALGIAVVSFFAVGSANATYDMVRFRAAEGDGLSSRYFSSFAFWNSLDELKADRIMTNSPELLFLHAGITAEMLPRKYNAVTGLQTPDFAEAIGKLQQAIGNGEVTIVYFRALAWRKYLPTIREIMALASSEPTYLDKEVVVYRPR